MSCFAMNLPPPSTCPLIALIRSLTTQQLKKCATQCIDELISMNQELEMLEMSAKFQVRSG